MVGGNFFGHGDGDEVAEADYGEDGAEEGGGCRRGFEGTSFWLRKLLVSLIVVLWR